MQSHSTGLVRAVDRHDHEQQPNSPYHVIMLLALLARMSGKKTIVSDDGPKGLPTNVISHRVASTARAAGLRRMTACNYNETVIFSLKSAVTQPSRCSTQGLFVCKCFTRLRTSAVPSRRVSSIASRSFSSALHTWDHTIQSACRVVSFTSYIYLKQHTHLFMPIALTPSCPRRSVYRNGATTCRPFSDS